MRRSTLLVWPPDPDPRGQDANLARAAAEDLSVDTIKRALHVTEQENDGFIEHVVGLMDDGSLSRKTVTIALKAKKRTRHKFQYFKATLIRLAEREGIHL